MMSVALPGVNGTTTFTAFDGYGCACAASATVAATARASKRAIFMAIPYEVSPSRQ
jgi:hypothetical protein